MATLNQPDMRPLSPRRVRPPLHTQFWKGNRDLLTIIALFCGFLALRVPFRSEFLVNWEAVQFALGTVEFNLQLHQPHPPGYVGYVTLGWAVNHLTGDPNASLTLISAVAGSIAPALFFVLARRFLPWSYALLVTIAFGTSPLVWYYSEVALPYAVELALALAFLCAAHSARRSRSFPYLILAAITLACVGSVRPAAMGPLVPVLLYAAWTFPWRAKNIAAGCFVAGCLAWLFPLLVLSGGAKAYLLELTDLARFATIPTSTLGLGLLGLARNVTFLTIGLIVGVNIGLIAIAYAKLRRVPLLGALTSADRRFMLLTVLPPLLFFSLVHIDQLGHLLLLTAVAFIFVGMAVAYLPHPVSQEGAARAFNFSLGQALLVGATGFFVLAKAFGLFLAPGGVYQLARSYGEPLIEGISTAVSDGYQAGPNGQSLDVPSDSVLAVVRQFDLQASDSYWQELIDLVQSYDSRSTAVLAVPAGGQMVGQTFQHLAYYLPEYPVYGVGRDRQGRLGYLFTAHGGTHNYSMQGMEAAQATLPLPASIERVVIMDRGISARLHESVDHERIELAEGAAVRVAHVPEGTTLLFLPSQDNEEVILTVQ